MDLQISLWIVENLSNPVFDIIGKIFDVLGNDGIVFFIISLILIINKKTRAAGIVLFLTLAVNAVATGVLKEVVDRPRPFVTYPDIEPLYHTTSLYSSFPSGHASFTFAFATIMAIYFPKYKIPLIAFAVIMAFTRVYGFVHYTTDVIAGAALGIIVALIVYKVYTKLAKKYPKIPN